MRKYRGKHVETGEWIYGYLIGDDVIVGEIVDWDDEYFCTEFWYKVDPKTVGQYTGITDVESNVLYDGDITEDEFGRKSRIYWDDNLARFVFQEHKKKTKYYLAIKHLQVRKIGNIHDHPHLLNLPGEVDHE